MSRRFTAIIESEGGGYVAFCPEVDIASQGETITGARENLAEALTLFLESASVDEIELRRREEIYVTQIEVEVG
ncbi:MAG: type II toxin-antitoxin system HicB family antitoxin [bacterium]|nr:type II toxin-antitoxin system HicB family antitoxin [bacterium]MDE0605092.1 type II toxin-antitoxin system HicB family antitoxin [bacterium]